MEIEKFENTLIPKIRGLIENKFGGPLIYSYQCEALADDIKHETGDLVSVSTLKRFLGFVNNPHIPRVSTLDVLAKYLGYDNFHLLSKDLGEDSQISDFTKISTIESEDLEINDILSVEYSPNRKLILKYIGENLYVVVESSGSKLQKDDIVRICQFAINFELLATEVIREGRNLGSYEAAKQGGITRLTHL